MRQKFVILVLIFLLAGSVMASENTSEGFTKQEVLAEFTFTKEDYGVFLPVKFKGEEYLFVLDTGATHTVFDTSLKHNLGEVKKTQKVTTGADPIIVEFFDAPEAFLGPLNMQDCNEVLCIDLDMLTLIAGKKIGGIIGMNFLKKHVVQINFDDGKVLFIAPKKRKESDWGRKLAIKYGSNDIPYVRGNILGSKKIYFAIDTGANATGDLESEIFEKMLSKKRVKTSETLTQTAGGARRTREVRIDSFSIGPLKYQGLVFGQGNMSRLGLSFLSRHVVTFDFPDNSIYLKAGKEFDKTDEIDMSGLHLLRTSNETVVHSVDEGSPAKKAGIQADDVIIRINNKGSDAYEMWEVRRLLKSKDGDKITMTIKSGGTGKIKDVLFFLKKEL
jgi:predicted aspartyl protease